MTKVSVSADTVVLLKRTLVALQGDTPPPAKKSLPKWLPNGEAITTLKQLAAVLCIDEKTAAYVVLDAYQPSSALLLEAKRSIGDRFEKGRFDEQAQQGVYRKAAQASQRHDPRGNGFVAGRNLGTDGQGERLTKDVWGFDRTSNEPHVVSGAVPAPFDTLNVVSKHPKLRRRRIRLRKRRVERSQP